MLLFGLSAGFSDKQTWRGQRQSEFLAFLNKEGTPEVSLY